MGLNIKNRAEAALFFLLQRVQNPVQEPLRPFFFWCGENLLRRSLFHDDAAIDEDDFVRHILGELVFL